MKAINLAITNADSLPDGGPLTYESDGRAFEIGRDTHRDWTLPDPELFISGRHCEVSFDGRDWLLVDVSRNGTFVNGGQQRVKSPYQLQHGDSLSIGNYIIAVSIRAVRQGDDVARQSPGNTQEVDAWGSRTVPSFSGDDDIWGSVSPGPAPANRRDFIPKQAQPAVQADFVQSHIDMPSAGSPGAKGEGSWSSPAQPRPVPGAAYGHSGQPVQSPSPFDGGEEPERSPRQTPSMQPSRGGGADPLGAFKLGARLPAHTLSNRDATEVSQEIGAIMLLVTEQMAHLLRARASAKSMVGAKNRTVVQAMDNNPLKFMADPSEALESMLSKGRSGYLDGLRAFREGFEDLKAHEMATYAAMQKALGRLLEDLSPEAIEARTEKSMLSNNKAKAWDTFVQRWEAKTEAHDNGMLDVFLLYFSEAYQEAEAKRRR